MTWDPTTGGPTSLPMPDGEPGFAHLQRVALALELQIRNAGIEYRKGTDQVQLYLDRAARLEWIQRMYHGKLPHEPGPHQPARLDGDHTGGEAA